jgi:replication-associated recombination protein RarA
MSSEMNNSTRPLADRMRPEVLADFLGQEEIVGEGKLLRMSIENDQLPSMIFWGPPGSGKTTLARIIANKTGSAFIQLSAVTSFDVKEKGNLPVPLHIRNAPTKLMKELGYGEDYKYSPDHGYGEEQEYLPEEIKRRKYLG